MINAAEEGREQMIAEQLPQVRYVARKIHERLPKHVELEDLVQAGVLGLIDAAQKFDTEKNVSFRSYAQFRVRGAILDSLRAADWSPRDLRRKSRGIEATIQKLSADLGRLPEDEEIATSLGIALGDLQHILGELRGLEVGSLSIEQDQERASADDRCLAIAADEQENPFHQCLQSEMRKMLASAIAELGEREQQVLSLYYFEELNMKEIGQVLGVVESRVSQIRSAAILKLRAILGNTHQATSRTHVNGRTATVCQ